MRRTLCVFSAMIFLMTGCAKIEIEQITQDNPYKGGLRFYRPYPYLWVTKDKDGKLQGAITYLPNRSEEYVIKMTPGIGSVDAKFTLENGWNLIGLNEAMDSKTPEMISALTGSLKDLTLMFPKAMNEELHPGLYMFVFDEKTGFINNLKPVVQFK